MLKKIYIFSFILLLGIACSMEEDSYKSSGKITGVDVRECSCCGGYYIEIEGNTYRFYNVPENSNLKLENPVFPVYVDLDWNPDPNACLGDEIIVTRITQQNR